MSIELPPIGQYVLQQRLSRDSSSEVWRAYDTDSRRGVLIKFFRTDHSHASASLADYVHAVERVAGLHHPNIVPVHDVHVLPSQSSGSSTALLCLATQYVEGTTLADYIRSTSAAGKLPPAAEIISIFSALAQALDSAHHAGIIHGNLKPTNILFDQGNAVPGKPGTPMLSDFGQTKFLPGKGGNDVPSYLSPEQIKGDPADEQSDIYALGVILYEIYTGTLPFQGKRPIAVMMQHVSAPPTPPDLVNPTISPAVTQVILRCLAKNPQERFPNVAALVVALADALRVPITSSLRRLAILTDRATSIRTPSRPLSINSAPSVQPPTTTFAPPVHSPPTPRAQYRRSKTIVTFIALLLVLGVGLGTSLWLLPKNAPVSTQVIGNAFFLNSSRLDGNSGQGLNDELQVDLSNIPDPAAGKSYYAWLLGDSTSTEQAPIPLGRLAITRGGTHLFYPGDGRHTNLLGFISRFLIIEDDAHNPTSDPLLNQSTWRYYAAIPQIPAPADKLHFSMLDHLRHLLVESPELTIRGLHGGLAFWLNRNTAIVSNLAHSLSNDWQVKDVHSLRTHLITMLDYLDGSSSVNADVPPNTPLQVNAHDVQIALLGPAPQSSDPPGYVYQNESPPGYVYLIETHLNGAILAPAATLDQRQLAQTIIKGIDTIKLQFAQIAQDTRQLLTLPDAQLLAASTSVTINEMATQAQDAYTGHTDPAVGAAPGGSLWVYTSLQRLTAFTVAPYVQSA